MPGFSECMAKTWPGITNKKAFCAWLEHEQTGRWPAEKSLDSEAFSLSLPIAKYDDQNGIVTGWAALSSANDKPLIDFHNELSLVSELEKAAHGLMIAGGEGKAGEMHEDRVGDVVESMVLTNEKLKALDPDIGDLKTEGWAVSMKLHDPGAIERVKNGKRPELSIHGKAKKIPVGEIDGKVIKALVDLEVDEISIVDQGASGNDDALPRIVIAKRREQEPTEGLGARFISQVKKMFGLEAAMNLDQILAELGEEKAAIILAAIEAAKAAAPVAPVVPPAPVVNQEGEQPKKEEEEEKTPEEMAKILAALPEEVRKQVEAGMKAKADAKTEVEKAKTETAELKKRLDDIEEREKVEKFKTKAARFPFLPGMSTEETAKLLRAASETLDAKEYEGIEKMLDGASKAVQSSPLFQDVGGRGNDSETTADGQIRAIAKKLREADPSLTPETALVKANDEAPVELRKQREAEARSARD